MDTEKEEFRPKRWNMSRLLAARLKERMSDYQIQMGELAKRTNIARYRLNKWFRSELTLSEEEFTSVMTTLNLCE